MEKRGKFRKILLTVWLCVVAGVIALVGSVYFHFISRNIYEDSAEHLREIYSQVIRTFDAFVKRNWNLLDNWGDSLLHAEQDGDEAVAGFIDEMRECWGFSEFYFLSEGRESVNSAGEDGTIAFGQALEGLFEDGQPVLTREKLRDGREITLLAVTVEPGRYRGFEYSAVAVSYTSEDMASSLNVDAFDGKAKCFVIRGDGSVFLSTQAGGSVYANYLTYLDGASDIRAEELQKVRDDWKNGRGGDIRCVIRGTEHCILYEPMDFQDYLLLSDVPQSVLSAGFLTIQQATMWVLIAVFLMVIAAVVTLMVLRERKRSKKSELELQGRDLMFEALAGSVNDIFLMLNFEDQSVDYISPNVERLLGIPTQEARANLRVMEKCAIDGDVFIPKEEFTAIPLNGSISRECEYSHQATGERRWYKLTIYHVEVQGVSKYIIIMSDHTQERQMNRQMEEALAMAKSANEAKSNFLSNMSHDIRTPMNAVVGFSVLLEKEADNPEKVREYTRKITTSSHHLLSLINDVLDMSKIESGKTSLNLDCFSLPELFEELNIMLMPQMKAKNHDFTTHIQGKLPERVVGDKLRLNQILINLLTNAIKYTPPGGKIEFRASVLPQTTPQFARLRFVVRDNGIGMSEEFQAEVFNAFSREVSSATSQIQGTGLGMAITKNLVDLMGGVITVESKLGQGSAFTVELSFAIPEEEKVQENWLRSRVARMLVADDEEEICMEIRELMRDEKVDVAYSTDGETAAKMAAQAHRRGDDFNVILLDWKMPGLNGVETARLIRRELGEDVPILVLTSYDWSDIEDEARKAGINAFLPKPFFVSSFWQAIGPLFADAPAPKESPEEPGKSPLAGLHFLVAEDNELNAEILTAMLELEDASFEVTGNGREALEAFEKSKPGQYDMILMDVQMPVMDGYEATRRIRALERPDAGTIPIVAMTANTFAEDVRNAMDAGMNGHLAKPIDMDAIRELIGRLTKGK